VATPGHVDEIPVMKPLERLDTATAPDGTVLTLYRHDGDYAIRLGGVELMSTRRHHSEERLAEVACEPLREVPDAQVLIGGLGFGFTLRAALRTLAEDARVVVVELLEAVVRWNERPDYPLAGPALQDPRVELRRADVADVLRERVGAFDAILLDVDNGAAPLTTRGNAALYRDPGIRTAAAALRPGGRLVYWSADEDRAFERALRRAALHVEVVRERAHARSSVRHVLYVGRRVGKR
jgi:spermidine synthase